MLSSNQAELTPQEKVTREWDAYAGEWDDLASGYATAFYNFLSTDVPLLDLDSTDSYRIVDFGCGTGLLTNLLRKHATSILAIDASTRMIDVLQEKIKSCEWSTVQAKAIVLAANASDASSSSLDDHHYGTYDFVVASSVLSFVPKCDRQATMLELSKLLKKEGLLIHSDWPLSPDSHPGGIDLDTARQLYEYGGLHEIMTKTTQFEMMGNSMDVFVGVAQKQG